ncbi:hypothetical protein AB0A99_10325 [Streptomyces fradiae]|uniref:hypothetical protein n=1 Tax=Streptomyces fradiae TaxID=1906 RepID=UPI0033FF1301
MKRAPHLLAEDRADFERLLGEALHSSIGRPDPATGGRRLDASQLRAAALSAAALINTAAAAEYEHFVRVRYAHRSASGVSVMASVLTRPGEEAAPGAGFAIVVTVLTPILAGPAALVLLLLGHALRMLDPPPEVAGPLVTAGWVFAAVAATGLLVAAACLLVTAARNRPAATASREPGTDPPEEWARAREAWHRALLERGIVPFLREALTEPADPRAASRVPVSGPPRALPPARGRGSAASAAGPDLTCREPSTE